MRSKLQARRRRKGDDGARMKRWLKAFADQDTKTITVRQIEKVLTGLQNDGMQPATLLRHLAVLKAVMNKINAMTLWNRPMSDKHLQ